jgi:hypothetical protein
MLERLGQGSEAYRESSQLRCWSSYDVGVLQALSISNSGVIALALPLASLSASSVFITALGCGQPWGVGVPGILEE